jgi:hypothetical protein
MKEKLKKAFDITDEQVDKLQSVGCVIGSKKSITLYFGIKGGANMKTVAQPTSTDEEIIETIIVINNYIRSKNKKITLNLL